jgi:HK97 family phage prohead protease
MKEQQMELRTLSSQWQSDGNRLTGLAAVYDSPTQIFEKGRRFTEIVRAGAFRHALQSGGDILATFNHNADNLLGRTSSGTLRLSDSKEGLRFEIELPDTPLGNTIRELTKRGDIKGASFAFDVRNKGKQNAGEVWNGDTRELTDLYLHELGPVTQPAYESTKVAVRSNSQLFDLKLKIVEKML